MSRYAVVGNGPGRRLIVSAGDVAGHLRKDGYWTVKLNCDGIKIHRIIFALHHDLSPYDIIDHIDGDNTNNKVNNLKASTDSLNGKNKSKYSSNTTGVTGVHVNEKMQGVFYYVATWRESEKIKAKSFNINKLGDEEAFRRACECRESAIKKLSDAGVQYTDRHGK